ncbi:MAG: Ldh family oxidoreductase [Acidimicrobiaceae bacterium]|nr:Ldh family oxidoreductase [Acidimicrobiaceae bacterium]
MNNDVVSLDDIETVTKRALRAHGATDSIAAGVAHAVRVAEANGNRICGLYYLESYCRQLRSGRVDGRVEPVVYHDRAGAVRVDAKFGFAQSAFAAGFDTAVAAAKANGTCGYAIEHSHTCTSLGYFTEQFAKVGLVAVGATNSTARVAPPGGSRPLLGTNPIAMAVPGPGSSVAFQFDFSTSAVALGKITMAASAGTVIPGGWAVDENGDDTTDPEAALRGSLVSAGGYKGYGLGLMVEVLAAALTGSLASVDVPALKAADGPPHDLGQFYLLIDPESFSGDAFADNLARLAERVDEQPGARLPGASRASADAVKVDSELWATAVRLSQTSGRDLV